MTYRVPGMSCEHCRRAVTDELGGMTGVTAVDVDLDAKL
jgi:copper chaperone CopZ